MRNLNDHRVVCLLCGRWDIYWKWQTNRHPSCWPFPLSESAKNNPCGSEKLVRCDFVSLSGRLKRSCTLADDLIRSPSLLQPLWFRQKARSCLLLFLFKDGSNVIMSSSFLISAPYVPCVSFYIERQRCHNGHSVAVEIPLCWQAIICILLQSQAGGLGHCWVDKSHQGVTLRKDLCVLPETTLLHVCSALIREMGWKGSPVAVKKTKKKHEQVWKMLQTDCCD